MAKFNEGWGITLQREKKIKTLNFFFTLSRASASIPYFTIFQITKKNVYIMPSFSHKKGRTQKKCLSKRSCFIIVYQKRIPMYVQHLLLSPNWKHWLVEDSSFLFSKRKEKWKNEGCQRCRKLTFSAILFFVH